MQKLLLDFIRKKMHKIKDKFLFIYSKKSDCFVMCGKTRQPTFNPYLSLKETKMIKIIFKIS